MTIFSEPNFSQKNEALCARAIAVMVIRFAPKKQIFYSAAAVSSVLKSLVHADRSSLAADVEHLKLGLKNTTIRQSLNKLYPRLFTFERSRADESIIRKGLNKFVCGFQIKFPYCYNNTIDQLPMTEVYLQVRRLTADIIEKCREIRSQSEKPDQSNIVPASKKIELPATCLDSPSPVPSSEVPRSSLKKF